MKKEIKVKIIIPPKEEADSLRKIIRDIENDKTPFRDLKLKKVRKKQTGLLN